MIDALKVLFENDVVSEDIKKQIEEAWENKVRENKLKVTAELREEFAQKYEHDKQSIVEAMDNMLAEQLQHEIAEFVEDRKQLDHAKIKYAKAMKEHATLMKEFIVRTLQQEIQELHQDKKVMEQNISKLENFVVESLSSEITEFYEDKQDLADTKVKLISEAKSQLKKLKANFVNKNAKVVSETVGKVLKSEISQLKEDIETARKNDFGRKIFEAFATEYNSSYVNEKSDSAKLMKLLSIKEKQLNEAKVMASTAKKLAESKETEKQQILENINREKTINDLISPLNKKQQEIMKDLLESVQTDRLKLSFDKYLPSVLNDMSHVNKKSILSEGKILTGNRSNKDIYNKADDSQVLDLRRLAGLK